MKLQKLTKTLLLSAVALSSVGLASCEPSTGEATQTITYPSLNFVYGADNGSPLLSWGAYTFNFNYTEEKETVSTSSLNYDNDTYSFATNGVKYEDISPSRGMGIYAGGFTGLVGQSTPLNDCQFYLASFPIPDGMEYVPSKKWIPKVENDGKSEYHPGAMYRPSYDIPPLVVGSYGVGNRFKVITCSSDMSFFGKTVTKYPGGSYENSSMVYRIFIDVKKKTADVVIYDAVFANNMPALAVVYLPSLPLILKDGNYEIVAENVIPMVPEGSNGAAVDVDSVLVPYPNFAFKSFKLTTVPGSLLSKVEITYKVGAAFEGSFEGKYVDLPAKMMK